MKKLLVLGAGTGGSLVANILSKKLPRKEWRITVVDKAREHHYQPGYLFIPFRLYGYEGRDSVARHIRRPLGSAVEFVSADVRLIDHAARKVETSAGRLDYDWLVLAMGCRMAPEETEGLGEALGKNAHTFYGLDEAVNFQKPLENFREGKLVVNVADMPVKCPVAPIEFAFLADYFFRKKGIRERIRIEYATPSRVPSRSRWQTAFLASLCGRGAYPSRRTSRFRR
ncbi:MAG: FAD-dependent oxidoreductase [Nitrospinae bacterium]|nr:FAD-dependent oxidoreductase [Nitrospinota bacterium]